MLDFDDIALDHECLEGHEFVDYRLVGIPVYRLVTDNIVLAKTPLSSLQSFVLRSIEIGMRSTEEISNSLGLDIATTNKVVGVLGSEAFVESNADAVHSSEGLRLTSHGQEVLNEEGSVAPEERTEFVEYEGWLRKPIRIGLNSLFSPKQLIAQGALIMPGIPGKPPKIDDISLQDVEKVLRLRDALESDERLLDMKRIARRLLKYRAAVAMLHRRVNDGDLRLSVVISGAPSNEHGWAFAAGGCLKRTDLIRGVNAGPISRRLRECLGEDAWSSCLSVEEFYFRRKEWIDAVRRVQNIRNSLAITEGSLQRSDLEEGLDVATEFSRKAATAIEEIPVRPVSPLEYPGLLMEALEGASAAVLIDTARLDPSFLRSEVLDLIEDKLRDGVRIAIRLNRKIDFGERPTPAPIERLLSFRKREHFSLSTRPRGAVFFLLRDDTFSLLSNRPILAARADDQRFFCQKGYLIRDRQLSIHARNISGPIGQRM